MTSSTVAEEIVAILQAVGVDTCFGVPGGQTVPFYGAARVRGFRHVLVHDERNGACAADAYARVSGKVGLCDATVGPGATNLISGLAEAYASAIPVLALVADIKTYIKVLEQLDLRDASGGILPADFPLADLLRHRGEDDLLRFRAADHGTGSGTGARSSSRSSRSFSREVNMSAKV